MKRVVAGLLTALLLLLALVLVRAATLPSLQVAVEPIEPAAVDSTGAVSRLSTALSLATIAEAPSSPAWNPEPFDSLHAFLEEAFPRLHAALDRELVGEWSALYTWPGTDPELDPILLLAHLDVVPVESNDIREWSHPPFSGTVADGYVWGRGAIDNKSGVMGALEAVEQLLAEGFEPARTVHLAFGHDEEIGGREGAVRIARLLTERGVRLGLVLDEGGGVIAGPEVPVAGPVALVGIAEKGYLSLELVARGPGGHSSVPPRRTTVGILSSAIHAIEASPLPGSLRSPTREMMAYLGPEMPFLERVVFSNLWLFRPFVERRMAQDPGPNALLRTTTAATMLEAGLRDNVLPTRAVGVVNVRIFPGETGEGVIRGVEEIIDDPRVEVRPRGSVQEASDVSPIDSEAFGLLHRTIREVFPEAVVAPYLVVGATDSRHYAGLTENIYRFLPVRMNAGDMDRIHGIDERVPLDGYIEAVRFYRRLLVNAQAGRLRATDETG